MNLITINVGSLVNFSRQIELNLLLDQWNTDIAFLQELHLPKEKKKTVLDFSQNYNGLVLGGDLNAKNIVWGESLNNFNGEVLSHWLQNESLSVIRICDLFPTYPNGSSHLDHFIPKYRSN